MINQTARMMMQNVTVITAYCDKEYMKQFEKFLLMLKYNLNRIIRNKKFIAGFMTIPVGMAITYLPLFMYSYRVYGLSYMFAPVSSVGQLFNFALDVNILSYTILFFMVRILKMMVLATFVMILSMKLKNNIKTIMCFLPFIVLEMFL